MDSCLNIQHFIHLFSLTLRPSAQSYPGITTSALKNTINAGSLSGNENAFNELTEALALAIMSLPLWRCISSIHQQLSVFRGVLD